MANTANLCNGFFGCDGIQVAELMPLLTLTIIVAIVIAVMVAYMMIGPRPLSQ